jgi:hypothetical protein
VKTCDEAIAQENDHLKLEVKRLEKIVSELAKQAKVRSSQDNYRNMVNKFEKGSTITKQASQQSNKTQPLKKQHMTIEYEKLEYARSAYLTKASHQEWNWLQGGRQAQLKGEQQWQRIHQIHQRQLSSSETRQQSS